MKNFIAIGIIAASTFALLALPAALAAPSVKDKGIAAYNARDYATASSLLQQATSANSKDGMAHYYLALTYQAMGRRSDAEREYKWNYEHGTDKDLKYKSWQGLANLSRALHSTAKAASTSGTAGSGSVAQAGFSSSPYSSRIEKGNGIRESVNFVPGCPNHR
jgi:tetratricopeptide (TPR) repeat protein